MVDKGVPYKEKTRKKRYGYERQSKRSTEMRGTTNFHTSTMTSSYLEVNVISADEVTMARWRKPYVYTKTFWIC